MPEIDYEALERRALDAWEVPELPAGFADRVATRVDAAQGRRPVQRAAFPLLPVAAAAVLGLLSVGAMAVGLQRFVPSDEPVAAVGLTTAGNDPQAVTPTEEQGPTWGAPELPDDFHEQVDRYVQGYGKNYGPAFEFHGAIVVARDGKVLYQKGFGPSDLTPTSAGGSGKRNGPTTRFRIGSLTQQFTAVSILQLHERGVLSIDDPVQKYLPAFEQVGPSLKIRHLLAHQSGLWNFTDDFMFGAWKRHAQDPDEVVGRIANAASHAEPGQEFEATNSNYLLLGRIVERASGRSYAEYLRENILSPAGMTQTSFGDAYDTGEQARGYVFNEEEFLEPAEDIHLPVMGGAGALVSSPADMIKWDAALQDDTLLKAETRDMMYTPLLKGYALGWVRSRIFGREVASHPGGVDGFNAHLMRFMDDHTMVLAIANTEVIDCRRVAGDIAALVYGHETEPRVEHNDIRMDPALFTRFEGRYELTQKTRKEFAGLIEPEHLEQLAMVFIVRDDDRLWMRVPRHGSKWMHPMAPERFFFKDDAGTTAKFFGDGDVAQWLVLERQGREFLLRRAKD